MVEPRWNRLARRACPELRDAFVNYFDLMVQRSSTFEIAVFVTSKFPMYAYHPLQAADRLGNPEIDFPIGIVFGDKDNLGSEGADQIVKANKRFDSGRSQLFRLADCTHEMTYD